MVFMEMCRDAAREVRFHEKGKLERVDSAVCLDETVDMGKENGEIEFGTMEVGRVVEVRC